jgi:hypothetical protein
MAFQRHAAISSPEDNPIRHAAYRETADVPPAGYGFPKPPKRLVVKPPTCCSQLRRLGFLKIGVTPRSSYSCQRPRHPPPFQWEDSDVAHDAIYTWDGGNVILFCPRANGISRRRASSALFQTTPTLHAPEAGSRKSYSKKNNVIIFPSPGTKCAVRPAPAKVGRTDKAKHKVKASAGLYR